MNKDTSKILHDMNFLNEAVQGGMFEVKLGKAAEQKAHSKEVKELSKIMVTDNSNADDTLRELAYQNNITLADTINNEKQDKISEMLKLSG